MKKLNLIGKKIGKLIVLEEVPKRTGSNQRRYRCFCEACGNSEYYIDTGELTRKRVKIKKEKLNIVIKIILNYKLFLIIDLKI